MKNNFFKSKNWETFSFQICLLTLTYFILFFNINSDIVNFKYTWTKANTSPDSQWHIKVSSKSSRRSFSDTYYLNIYNNQQFLSSVTCDGIMFEKYCKEKLKINQPLPIQNLVYEIGVSPSKNNISHRIFSFEIIDNNQIKKIENLSPTYKPNKHSNYLFTSFAIFFTLLVHFWVIYKWLKTHKRHFTKSNYSEYFLIKIGLPISSIVLFVIFIHQLSLSF